MHAPARDAPRRGEGEPARTARRRPGAHAAPCRTRLGPDAPAHHDRFQRVAARVRHRRAPERAGLRRRAHADPPVQLSRAAGSGRRDAVGLEHALRAADRRDDPDRALRLVERGPREECVSHGAGPPLRPAHADDLGHPLQLVDARHHDRRILRADPQLQARVVPSAVPVRRLAGLVFELRRRARARVAEYRQRQPAHAARHLAAHGAPGLPERRAGHAFGQLQQPGELRCLACRRR